MTQLSTLAVLSDQSAKATLPAAIAEHRTNTLSNLEQLAVPTRRTEHWKYSAKRLGELSALSVNSDAANASDEEVLRDALTLRIVNGQVDKASLDAINSANLGVAAKLFSELSDEEASLVASHAALSVFCCFLDAVDHFVSLTVAYANTTFVCARYHKSGEGETTSTLHDLRNPVDVDDLVDQIGVFFVATTAVHPAHLVL